MSKIIKVRAREVLDSRLNPTVEGIVYTKDGTFKAMVPSGASTGTHEALELRDGDKSRYGGKGVLKAVGNVIDKIGPVVLGMDPVDQVAVDQAMLALDGTAGLSNLGANATLAVSMAVARAGAAAKDVPLYRHIADLAGVKRLTMPVAFQNDLNGGRHAANKLALQEFMVAATGAASSREGLRVGAEVFHALEKVIKERYGGNATNVGNEGGFAPDISEATEALDMLVKAVSAAGHDGVVQFGIDPAASEFYSDGLYDLDFKKEKGKHTKGKTPEELDKFYEGLVERYPQLALLEDPHHEEGFEDFRRLTAKIGKKVEVVGDDIFVTNLDRLKRGINMKAANSVLIKLNQNGTVSGTLEVVAAAKKAGWSAFGSHRSGETEDTFLADFVVGANLGHVEFGSSRSERVAKANRLTEIEEELGGEARYAGKNFRVL